MSLVLVLLLALLFCLLLALLFSVLFIIAPDLRVLLAVLEPVLLYFILLATGSLAVVPVSCFFLTTCSLAVVPSVLLLQSHSVVSCDSVARFWLHSNITTQHCAFRD